MELKFVADRKPKQTDPIVARRQKLARRIDQQIGHVRAMIAGQKPNRAWLWMDSNGNYFVPFKYGRHPLELRKGMFATQCKDLDEAEHAFCTVRAMVISGKLDAELAKVSGEIRQKFQAS